MNVGDRPENFGELGPAMRALSNERYREFVRHYVIGKPRRGAAAAYRAAGLGLKSTPLNQRARPPSFSATTGSSPQRPKNQKNITGLKSLRRCKPRNGSGPSWVRYQAAKGFDAFPRNG
jgi:hypothetical protein